MSSLPVILAWLVGCVAAGGPHPDGHLKLVAPVAMPGALCLHFPRFHHIFSTTSLRQMLRPLQKHIAIYCQTLGNCWKPLETVVETIIKTKETVETVNSKKENKGGLFYN